MVKARKLGLVMGVVKKRHGAAAERDVWLRLSSLAVGLDLVRIYHDCGGCELFSSCVRIVYVDTRSLLRVESQSSVCL